MLIFKLLSTSYLILLARAPISYINFGLVRSFVRDTLTVPARRKLPTSGNGYACTCILSVLLVNLTALLKASWSIRLINRSNIASLSPLDYHKKHIAILFLDHICTHLAEQFSSLSITATSILQLVPSVMRSKEINLSEVVKQYSSDMPSPELVDKELLRWKSKYSSVKTE